MYQPGQFIRVGVSTPVNFCVMSELLFFFIFFIYVIQVRWVYLKRTSRRLLIKYVLYAYRALKNEYT